MTGSEILSYCETRLGRSLDSDLALEAINESLREIADAGLLYATATVTVDNIDNKFEMPGDYTYIEQVIKQDDGEEYIYEDYTFRGGQIEFENEGEYEVIARKMPENIENISDSLVEIHPLFYNAIKYYVLAWFKENDQFGSKGSQVLYERFNKRIIKASKTLLRSEPNKSWRVIRNA